MEDLIIEEEGASSALKITLGDFLVFINWMNQTEKALDRGEALPTTPDLDSGKVRGWVQLVQRLEERFRRSEEKKIALEANAKARLFVLNTAPVYGRIELEISLAERAEFELSGATSSTDV